jgi:hypothetical protein
MSLGYASTADELVRRILALMPQHPKLLTMDDPWQLFSVPGFSCVDLSPSMQQASWALKRAQALYAGRDVTGEAGPGLSRA